MSREYQVGDMYFSETNTRQYQVGDMYVNETVSVAPAATVNIHRVLLVGQFGNILVPNILLRPQ